ncbi:MAG: NUDIX hydrolase [Pseudomonadota bacterium]
MTEPVAADFDPRHKGKRHRNLRPKPAASLILIKQHADGPRFLLGKRAETLAFLPGYFVFPGGRLERSDRANNVTTPVFGEKIGRHAARLAACAHRELAEETGLHLPGSTRLSYVARAITPPYHVRRYDTRFFACVVDDEFGAPQNIKPQDDELDPIGWFSRADVQPDKLHRITSLVLSEVEKRLSGHSTLENDAIPIPCFRFRHGKPVVEYD